MKIKAVFTGYHKLYSSIGAIDSVVKAFTSNLSASLELDDHVFLESDIDNNDVINDFEITDKEIVIGNPECIKKQHELNLNAYHYRVVCIRIFVDLELPNIDDLSRITVDYYGDDGSPLEPMTLYDYEIE